MSSHMFSSQSKPFDIVLYFVNEISTIFYGDGDVDGDDIGTSMWNWEPLADPSHRGLTTFLQS